jgi:transposase
MMIRDEFGKMYADEEFSDLFPPRGRGAESAEILALATLLQFVEGLTDRQAALAVRGRIDWKYCLGLSLEDTGFDPTILSDFRARLVEGGAERRLLELLLKRCEERRWVKAGGTQRTDATHVLGAIRSLNRLETTVETFRQALNALAVAAPQWLRPLLEQEWVERYAKRVEESRLPQKKAVRQKYAKVLGNDGMRLLEAIDSSLAPAWLRELPAVRTLRRVWIEQFYFVKKKLLWRPASEQPPATVRIVSPYDVEARAGFKGDKSWEGYKTHLTETVDPKAPQLIVDVHTSPATRGDSEDLPAIHQRLERNGLLPDKQLVDGAYISAELLVQSRQRYGIELVGPARPDSSPQARAQKGFAQSAFRIDFDKRSATCPGDKHLLRCMPNGQQDEISLQLEWQRGTR